MLYRIFVFTLIFFVQKSILAESSFPPHQGSSPWSFTVIAEPSDTFVVNDADSATIDQELQRKDGSIFIDVPIRRYVGKTDTNGFLLNTDHLVMNGVVSRTATIVMPAFDIDDDTFPDYFDCDGDYVADELQNEVDEVFLNGEKIGVLKGDNDVWQQNTFTVDITKIKFPSAPGETAINQFRIDVDTANVDVVLSSGAVGCANGWSTAIDWVGLQYEAASPVVLVHGILSSGATFLDFQAGLDNRYVVSDASINLTDLSTPDPLLAGCPDIPYNNSIDHNIDQLKTLIPSIAELYGTDSIHLVTHSKGGLDTRGFLSSMASMPIEIPLGTMNGQEVKRDLEALSLITLNTPHQGSVLAVYGVEARQLSILQLVQAGLNASAASFYEGAYYCDLTPVRASAFISSTTLPKGIETASVATDADQDGDEVLTSSNSMGVDEGQTFPLGATAADLLYQLTGGVANVNITVSPGQFMDKITVTETPTVSFQTNDAIVTKSSAGLYPTYDAITGWHHLNVHSTENAEAIATDAQQESGKVNWRLR